jgi:hypothetical protein
LSRAASPTACTPTLSFEILVEASMTL